MTMPDTVISNPANNEKKRIWEIDFVRGIAILFMVLLHFLFVTSTFFGYDIFANKESLLYNITKFLQDYGGILFIFISGISSIFSNNNFKRGSQLFLVAMGITYITIIFNYIIQPDNHNYVVRFGILHFLSVCMMLAPLFIKTKGLYLLPLSAVIIGIGYYCRTDSFGSLTNTFTWFDKSYPTFDIPALTGYEIVPWFRSADYFPLMPYLGFFILGIVVGRIVYKNKKSIFKSEKIEKNLIVRFFSFCGRHTLAIYLAHQPVLFGIMYLITRQ